MSAWELAKGLLIRDGLQALIGLGVLAVFFVVAMIYFYVQDWDRSRRHRKVRESELKAAYQRQREWEALQSRRRP